MHDKWIKWNKLVAQYRMKNCMREGQMYLNALFMVDPTLSSLWTNTEYDCFYDNSKCGAFMEKLMKTWNEENGCMEE